MSGQPIDGTRHGGRHASSPTIPKPRPTARTARCKRTLTVSPSAAAPQPPASSAPRWATGERPRAHQPDSSGCEPGWEDTPTARTLRAVWE